MKTFALLTLVLANAALVACGDSPAEIVVVPPVVSNEVPASATASVSAYVQYSRSLAANDTAEPLLVDKVTPPVSETEEPAAVS